PRAERFKEFRGPLVHGLQDDLAPDPPHNDLRLTLWKTASLGKSHRLTAAVAKDFCPLCHVKSIDVRIYLSTSFASSIPAKLALHERRHRWPRGGGKEQHQPPPGRAAGFRVS